MNRTKRQPGETEQGEIGQSKIEQIEIERGQPVPGQTTMTNRIAELPLRATARIAGVLYLIIIVAGIFAQFFVRQSLYVPGDAAATAANVAASEGLFRAGMTADLIMVLSDVALALAFFVLLRPVNVGLSLLAAFFRLVQASVLGMNLLNLFVGLQLVTGGGDVAAVSAQADALAMLFFDAHSIGYVIGLAFFGMSILVLGYLVYKAEYFPAILGLLLMVASVGYMTDTFANFLLPNYADYATLFGLIVFAPALIAELSMALWLLVKGVKDQPSVQPEASYSAQASREAHYA